MIAQRVGCHRSTISREIRRRSWSPERDHANLRPDLRNKLDTRMPRERIYLAWKAQHHANTRKDLSPKPYRMSYDPLVHHVFSRLRDGWTPEEIGGRLPHDFPDDPRMRVVREPSIRGFMGRAGRSDNWGNTCPEAIRNAGNAVAGRFTLTGSDGVCQFMTARWTSNPGPPLDIGNQTALLVQVTRGEYTPVWNANPGLYVGRRFLQSPWRPPGVRNTDCSPSCPPTRLPL